MYVPVNKYCMILYLLSIGVSMLLSCLPAMSKSLLLSCLLCLGVCYAMFRVYCPERCLSATMKPNTLHKQIYVDTRY